jgi:hypothetical protein
MARSWDGKAFPNWTPEFVDRLLTNSPWAKPVTVPLIKRYSNSAESQFAQVELPRGSGLPPVKPGSGWPGGSGGSRGPRIESGPGTGTPEVRTEAYLTIRWSSALPIRQALALSVPGRDRQEAVALVAPAERDHVIDVFGFPAILLHRDVKQLEKDLAKTAKLLVKGRSAVSASSVRVPEHGMHLSATLRFPGFDNLRGSEGTVQFFAEAMSMKIVQDFKLNTMTYEGTLEL